MLEFLGHLLFSALMVPVAMALILGIIYVLAEVFNVFSGIGHRKESKQQATRQ